MKKYIYLSLLIVISTILTGCFKSDKMEGIKIVTTIYPIEYVTNRLYQDYASIKSIYPRNSVSSTYKITDKQLQDYSENDLLIYNGNSKEKEYAKDMLKHNKSLKIIDAAYGLDTTYTDSDIWLNPSNILMIGQNIKNELSDYLTNPYLVSEIDNKYTLLKVDITELETELKKTADNSVNKKIIVADESLNFLERYGFEVINLTANGKNKDSNIDTAKTLLSSKKLSYVFVIEHLDNPKIVETLKNDYKIETLQIKALDTISEKDETNNEDYLSLMHYNISQIQKETYK